MQFLSAAFDYDGTLAKRGTVGGAVVDALRALPYVILLPLKLVLRRSVSSWRGRELFS